MTIWLSGMGDMWVSHDVEHVREQRTPAEILINNGGGERERKKWFCCLWWWYSIGAAY